MTKKEQDTRIEALATNKQEINQEMANLDATVREMEKILETKIDDKAIKPIWKYLDRFALYEDLKNLHNMVIPEIAKFEQKIINFNKQNETNKLII